MMKIKEKYSVLSALLLFAVLLFSACADDLGADQGGGTTEYGPVTHFVSNDNSTRTSMNELGYFSWTAGDKIWVKNDNGDTLLSVNTEIHPDNNRNADFAVRGDFENNNYLVFYTGSSSAPNIVQIASKQVQSEANNADHYAVSGDCGTSIATRASEDERFKFTLHHKASYLYFEPRVSDVLAYGLEESAIRVKKITLRKKNSGTICGTYRMKGENEQVAGELALDTANVTNGGKEITVICGKDVEDFDAGRIAPNTPGLQNGFPLYEEYKGEKNRIFMVLQPGEHELEVEYTLAVACVQDADHPTLWGMTYTDSIFVVTRDLGTVNFEENKHYRLLQKLTPSDLDVESVYEFPEYYMWGAKKWFWDGVANYPVMNDGYQDENLPEAGTDRWFHGYQGGDVCYGYEGVHPDGYTYTPRINNFDRKAQEYAYVTVYTHKKKKAWKYSADSTALEEVDTYRHGMPNHKPWGWDGSQKVLTANQMSYYVVYGDPYYDNEKEWILKEYNGTRTICRGGVWLKKKAAIIRDNPSISWPDDNVFSVNGNLAAPFPGKKAAETYTNAKDQDNNKNIMDGLRYNLFYMAPIYNYRMPYTNAGKMDEIHNPRDAGKDINDYFFVPCLGRIEYQHAGSEGKPTLTLVGAQGFYWTRNAVMYSNTATQWCRFGYGVWTVPAGVLRKTYDNNSDITGSSEMLIYKNGGDPTDLTDTGDYYDNAFYFNIHYNYIALSWQQRSVYVKTGMRLASTSIFE